MNLSSNWLHLKVYKLKLSHNVWLYYMSSKYTTQYKYSNSNRCVRDSKYIQWTGSEWVRVTLEQGLSTLWLKSEHLSGEPQARVLSNSEKPNLSHFIVTQLYHTFLGSGMDNQYEFLTYWYLPDPANESQYLNWKSMLGTNKLIVYT